MAETIKKKVLGPSIASSANIKRGKVGASEKSEAALVPDSIFAKPKWYYMQLYSISYNYIKLKNLIKKCFSTK